MYFTVTLFSYFHYHLAFCEHLHLSCAPVGYLLLFWGIHLLKVVLCDINMNIYKSFHLAVWIGVVYCLRGIYSAFSSQEPPPPVTSSPQCTFLYILLYIYILMKHKFPCWIFSLVHESLIIFSKKKLIDQAHDPSNITALKIIIYNSNKSFDYFHH